MKPSIVEDEKKVMSFFESYKFRNHGNYIESIKKLERVFSPSQIQIIWFDDVIANPRETMKTFVDRLSGLDVPVNVSTKMKMPKGIEVRLKSIYHDMMLEMAAKYESAPRKWYDLYFHEDENFAKRGFLGTDCSK